MLRGVIIPGRSVSDSLAVLEDGYFHRGTGIQTTVPADDADTVMVENIGDTYVRVTLTFAAGVTTAGNLSALVSPGGSFQESFEGAVIASVSTESVTLGLATTPVTTLAVDPAEHVASVKFVEG